MEKTSYIKLMVSGFFAWLSAKLGILGIVFIVLMGVMVIDYITGIIASAKDGKLESKTGMWGIVKKLLYALEVTIGMFADWLILSIARYIGIDIPIGTFFGLLISIWLIGNELGSIIENFTRMDVGMPPYLITLASFFKVASEKSGSQLVEKVKKQFNKEE